MSALIERHGGVAFSAPSMREVPKERQDESLEFAVRLFDGNIDAAIFLTGVGTRLMFEAIALEHSIEDFKSALSGITTIARGPKPVAAFREHKLKPDVIVPEPNTWQDLLETLDAEGTAGGSLDGKTIAVQEYGLTNTRLVEALEQRGATVFRVPVYRWALPEDSKPLQASIDKLIAGELDVAMFTSATQVYHLFELAEKGGQKDALREAFKRTCIASVGPVCTEAIVDQGLVVDYEPDATHMLPLVRESARRSQDLLEKKRVAHASGIDTNTWSRTDMVWLKPQPKAARGLAPSTQLPTIADSVFMKACRREPTPYTPVWIMRQAGRYQREYRAIRKGITLLQLCHDPVKASEVTLMAVDRLGADAAIIFSDILPIVEPLGFNLEYVKGDGPVIHNPYRDRDDIKRLANGSADDLAYVYEALSITRKALRPDVALIGFCGAPFTIASYMIEGGKSKNYSRTKTMMYRDELCWNTLMDRLVDILIDYLNKQLQGGADAVQVFDSWAGSLSPDDYRKYVMPHVKRLIAGVKAPSPDAPKPPVINFSTGNPCLLPLMKEAGGDVIGLDWRVDLAEAWEMLGHDDVAVMGNLDPVVLYGSTATIREHTQHILDKAAGRPGHIFNLGHGISPDMSPEHVAELVDAVQQMSKR